MRKSLITRLIFLTALSAGLIAIVNPFYSCKKVDQHASLIENQPWLVTEAGLSGLFSIWQYQYQVNFIAGDTMTLVGKLFAGNPGSDVEVGGRPVTFVQRGKVSQQTYDTRTGQPDSLDVVRFVLTKDFGTGSNISVTVHANGLSVQGQAISIKLVTTGDRKTDTTMTVDLLGSWMPGNTAPFLNIYNAAFVNNCSVSGNGTIYFDNLEGIYRLMGGQTSTLVAQGSTLTDQQQQSFSIDVIISSVISGDGNTLVFSSLVNEQTPAADSLYIVRLCRMDMTSKQVTTLNRTTVFKGQGTYQEVVGPFAGNIANLKIVAAYLQTDAVGNIWFTNFYDPESNLMNPVTYSNYNSTIDWYENLSAGNNTEDIPFAGLFNICRMDASGTVISPIETNPFMPWGAVEYSTPGTQISDAAPDFLLSPDGTLVYGLKYPSVGFVYGLNQYSMKEGDIENTVIGNHNNISFISFDTSAATRLSPTGNFFTPQVASDANFNQCLLLPNNDLLFVATSSIYAYDFDNMTAYCYAGTENQNATVQTNLTGNAKYVNFNGNNLRFCGIDAQGAVYYFTGGSQGAIESNDYTNGVRFYKLHSNK